MPGRNTAALAFAILLAFAPPFAAGQIRLGQYEDEAPLRTWNAFPAASAAGLGRGTVALAWADGSFSAWSNPALLTSLSRPSLSLSASIELAQCERFSLVNTGVVSSESPLWAQAFLPDGLAAGALWKGWALAAAVGAWESYARPEVLIDRTAGGRSLYGFELTQSGRLWAGTLAAARRLGSRLSLGLSLHALWGGWQRGYVESWRSEGFELRDERSMTFRGFVPQAGISWEATSRWTLGATLRGPWDKRARTESLASFAAEGRPAVSISAGSQDDGFAQPWVAGLGAAFRPSPDWTLAADAIWLGWSAYSARVFGEDPSRDFKDVVRLSLGGEMRSTVRLFGRRFEYPLRLGFVYDPQPMRDPRSAYLVLAFGSGLGWGKVRIDLGAQIGREGGSGSGLTARRVGLSLSVEI